MIKIGLDLQQFDLNFVGFKSVWTESSSVSNMIRVGYNSGRSLLDSDDLD